MKKSIYILSFCLLLLSKTFAQEFDFANYRWEINPAYLQLSDSDKVMPEVGLLDKTVIEIVVDDNKAYMYNLVHRVVLLNSEEAITRNNKIYIPVDKQTNFKQLIRVISPNGSKKILDKSDIFEATDESSGVTYQYYAIEGLEKGSILEHISVLKYTPNLKGATINLQEDYPIKNLSFEMFIPKYLVFEFRTYNGLSEMAKDTADIDRVNRYYLVEDHLDPLPEEEYQNYDANLKKISYKLTGNSYSQKFNLNNFKDFIQGLNTVIQQTETSKKEQKIISKYIQASKADFARSDEDKIRKIEDFVKESVIYKENSELAGNTIEEIDKTHVAGQLGLYILYANLFKQLGIKTQLAATCNRFDDIYDKNFENFQHIDNFLFYFPDYDEYLFPQNILFRYPFIPYQFTANGALFMKTISVNNVDLTTSSSGYIEPKDMYDSRDSMYVKADFSEGIETPSYNLTRTFTGYEAVQSQGILSYIQSDDDKKKVREEIVKQIASDVEVTEVSSRNDGVENFAIKPFEIYGKFKCPSLLEKAGDTYLLKVGLLIGPQVEIYDSIARKTDIEIPYRHQYRRVITVDIPEGYTINDVSNHAKSLQYKDDEGNDIYGFLTTITQEGNQLTIDNTEYYNAIRLDHVKYYQTFREVINSAADFNKIVLILQPQ